MASRPAISVLIPARDEARFLPRCLASIEQAEWYVSGDVEVVVALNRCTDATEAIAKEWGAVVTYDDSRNLSKVRNAAAAAASGEYLVTLDADSEMSPKVLHEVQRRLNAGDVVGGGVWVLPSRWSFGVGVTLVSAYVLVLTRGLSGGAFWCDRADFEALGGFDESFVSAEDLDFAQRLRTLGQSRGQRFETIWRAHIVTSMRKFDHFGDWYFFRHPRVALALVEGKSPELANAFWYDVER